MPSPSYDWTGFLQRSAPRADAASLRSFLQGKRIAITGAGGFIGSALARSVAQFSPETLTLIDIVEHGLHDLHTQLTHKADCHYVVGDICDPSLVNELFSHSSPHIVFHAAATKHVWLMEHNPFAAARTNALGTQQLLSAASTAGAEQFVLVSTDKAVSPASMMGASKRIAELCILMHRGPMVAKALRLGNVLGSTGSVVPLFEQQLALEAPLTITDAACARFFMSIDEAVQTLCATLLTEESGVYIPAANGPHSIMDLARFMLRASGHNDDFPMTCTGLRPGEKITEAMLAPDEHARSTESSLLRYLVQTKGYTSSQFETFMGSLQKAVETRDINLLLDAATFLLPSFHPSRTLTAHREGRA